MTSPSDRKAARGAENRLQPQKTNGARSTATREVRVKHDDAEESSLPRRIGTACVAITGRSLKKAFRIFGKLDPCHSAGSESFFYKSSHQHSQPGADSYHVSRRGRTFGSTGINRNTALQEHEDRIQSAVSHCQERERLTGRSRCQWWHHRIRRLHSLPTSESTSRRNRN